MIILVNLLTKIILVHKLLDQELITYRYSYCRCFDFLLRRPSSKSLAPFRRFKSDRDEIW